MLATVLLAAAFVSPQTASPKADIPASKIDPKLHADSAQLVELSGLKKKVQETLSKGLADGSKKIMEQCPSCKPEFAEEWTKRMLTRMNPDEFTAVYLEEYEKYLTDDEIVELIKLQQGMNEGHPVTPTDQLKEKLTKVLPSLMSETMGRCTQIGAKLGAEVAGEITKEHPDWAGTPVSAPVKP
jgi:hypothetical protein